ncbi:hypothetical protein INS49_010716 [Diaporthe citri]|uniref:uncharacterized protein n=1 Tax=Diaporthe citri TaxID=83186 RepID=UPI001C819E3E|nr:uncharacterized protein INS49_010716 [Diaporthe citri]KAG6362485.1 hypothetical protein INS49_010716 [Diaporthe citri]
MKLLIALIALLTASVKGVNILFFAGDGVCDTSNDDFLVCSDLPQHRCCQSPQKSFCGTSILEHISGTTDHYVMAEGFCDKNGNYTSTRDYTGLSNCISIPTDDASDRCSSYWESVADQDGVSGGGDHSMDCQEPDRMAYHDGTAMRQIHLPDGTFWDAMKYYQEKNYGELAAFPAWNGSDTKIDG